MLNYSTRLKTTSFLIPMSRLRHFRCENLFIHFPCSDGAQYGTEWKWREAQRVMWAWLGLYSSIHFKHYVWNPHWIIIGNNNISISTAYTFSLGQCRMKFCSWRCGCTICASDQIIYGPSVMTSFCFELFIVLLGSERYDGRERKKKLFEIRLKCKPWIQYYLREARQTNESTNKRMNGTITTTKGIEKRNTQKKETMKYGIKATVRISCVFACNARQRSSEYVVWSLFVWWDCLYRDALFPQY